MVVVPGSITGPIGAPKTATMAPQNGAKRGAKRRPGARAHRGTIGPQTGARSESLTGGQRGVGTSLSDFGSTIDGGS
jgi:hypothetical protein